MRPSRKIDTLGEVMSSGHIILLVHQSASPAGEAHLSFGVQFCWGFITLDVIESLAV